MSYELESLHARYSTPYKQNHYLIEPSGQPHRFDCCGVDIPFVFWHGGRYLMLYTGYDGIGYQSALAESNNLIDWQFYTMVTPRMMHDHWDSASTSAASILKQSNDLTEIPKLQKMKGRYWLVYNSYPSAGYEEGPSEIGLAWCENEDLRSWHRMPSPIFSWRDGAPWERGGMYNTCLLSHEDKFYLFYNAKNTAERWSEQIGIACSDDLLHWTRLQDHPVIPVSPNGFDSRFCANPYVVRDNNAWLCFYFGFDGHHAHEGLAVSTDLLHWEKTGKPLLSPSESGTPDQTHAHKPCVFLHKGMLWHFYCGVRPRRTDDSGGFGDEYRGICLATSKPI